MPTITLPRTGHEFLHYLIKQRDGRKHLRVPGAAAVAAYNDMKCIRYGKGSSYENLSSEIHFGDGITAVFEKKTMEGYSDRSRKEVNAAVTFYKDDVPTGALVGQHIEGLRRVWKTNASVKVKTLEPYLDALEIYQWMHNYHIPLGDWGKQGVKQLEETRTAASLFCVLLKRKCPPIEGLRMVELPLLKRAQRVSIKYRTLDLEHMLSS